MVGLIIGNGNMEDYKLLKKVTKEVDYIVCADGGAKAMAKLGLKPDLVIGDLDSIDKVTLKYLKENDIRIKKFPKEKDYTDTELSIKYLVDRNIKEIVFVGMMGSRFDHTLANVFLLKKLLDKGVTGKIIDSNNTVYIVDKKITLKDKRGCFVSIIPISNEGAIVTLEGFKYNTVKEYFPFTSTYGISNEIVEKKGIVGVDEGVCLVIISKD